MTSDEFRAHLIEVGRDPRHLARLLDFWEPLIRADATTKALELCCADTEPDIRKRVAEEIAAEVQALLDAEKDNANVERDWALLQCASIAHRIGGAS